MNVLSSWFNLIAFWDAKWFVFVILCICNHIVRHCKANGNSRSPLTWLLLKCKMICNCNHIVLVFQILYSQSDCFLRCKMICNCNHIELVFITDLLFVFLFLKLNSQADSTLLLIQMHYVCICNYIVVYLYFKECISVWLMPISGWYKMNGSSR